MKVTQRERFEDRIQDWFHADYSWVPWGKTKRCDNCESDLTYEHMFRIKLHWSCQVASRTWWEYLCRDCAPDKEAAMSYWSVHKGSS